MRRPRLRHTQHVYPEDWRPDDWVVPFDEGHACIHHGHEDPDDHSLCGPRIFCCQKSASLYIGMFPDSAEARATWELTEASHIATWLDAGVPMLYFIFCDPVRPDGLLFIGLASIIARDVLHKRIPLERYAERADRVFTET